MSVMQEALAKAGYVAPEDRPMAWALEAWGKWPNYRGEGARIGYLKERFGVDPTWCAFKLTDAAPLTLMLRKLLLLAMEKIEAERPPKLDKPKLSASRSVWQKNRAILCTHCGWKSIGDWTGQEARETIDRLGEEYPTGSHWRAGEARDATEVRMFMKLLVEEVPDEATISSVWAHRPDLADIRDKAKTICAEKARMMRDIQEKAQSVVFASGKAAMLEPEYVMKNALRDRQGKAAEFQQQRDQARLRAFLIDGKSLEDCTAEEALAWCDRQETNIAWIRALCHGVPLNSVLGRWYGDHPEEVEEIWQRVNSPEAREMHRKARDAALAEWSRLQAEAETLGAPFAAEVQIARNETARYF